jgi:hypothetical protein
MKLSDFAWPCGQKELQVRDTTGVEAKCGELNRRSQIHESETERSILLVLPGPLVRVPGAAAVESVAA